MKGSCSHANNFQYFLNRSIFHEDVIVSPSGIKAEISSHVNNLEGIFINLLEREERNNSQELGEKNK